MAEPTAGLRVEVLSFKEGLLSRVAHDLAFDATELTIDPRERPITVSVPISGLRVRCARHKGQDVPGELSEGDRVEIEQKLRTKVIDASRWPVATFRVHTATRMGDSGKVHGVLSIAGHERQQEVSFHRRPEGWHGEFQVNQPDFGITPFRAALGALKVQAHVTVRVAVTDELAQMVAE